MSDADQPVPEPEPEPTGRREAAAHEDREPAREHRAPDGRRPFFDQVAEDEWEWRQRSDSLRTLRAGGLGAEAGRDWIGRISNEVSGGTLQYAARDLYYVEGGGAEKARIRHMPEQEARHLAPAHLAPIPCLNELRRALEHKPLVLLRGEVHTGRLTAALAALLGWAAKSATPARDGEAPLGHILMPRAASHLKDDDIRPGHGYVLESDATDWAERLAAEMPALTDLAVKRRCRLVILVTGSTSTPWGPVIEHRHPAAAEVFDRWLARETREYGVATPLPDSVRHSITERLSGEKSPSKAVEYAHRMALGLVEGRPADEVLADLPDQVHEDICTRLAERRPLLGRCFMASVAVLHGLPETTVSQEALDLADRIGESWHRERKARPIPAWEQLPTWLDYADATTRPSGTAGGGRIVELRRRATAATTLRVLWEEQPAIREPLISWLRHLGDAPSTEARVKSAHAVGLIATLDFDVVEEEFLRPWSRSQRPSEQRLAAWALEVAAQDPVVGARVRDHLQIMARSRRTGERTVAVRTYGSRIGIEAPGEALDVFDRAVAHLSAGVRDAIASSVAIIYSTATAGMIIERLIEWAEDEEPGSRYTAAATFLRLAAVRGGDPGRPALIELTADEEIRGRLIVLWLNALTLKIADRRTERPQRIAGRAWPLLADWAANVERPAVLRVIEGIVTAPGAEAPRLRAALALHLRLWKRRGRLTDAPYALLMNLVNANRRR